MTHDVLAPGKATDSKAQNCLPPQNSAISDTKLHLSTEPPFFVGVVTCCGSV